MKISAETPRLAFFSSRLTNPMMELRHFAADLGEKAGYRIQAPHFAEWKERAFIQEICLQEVKRSSYFLCVLDGSYGMPWNAGDLSVLEMEIFTAILNGKPGRIWIVEPFDPDPRMQSLLRAVKIAAPHLLDTTSRSIGATRDEIRKYIEQIIGLEKGQLRYILGRFQQSLAIQRSSWKTPRVEFFLDVTFLDGNAVPLTEEEVDEQKVTYLLDLARNHEEHPKRLVQLWSALRHLSSAPIHNPKYVQFLPLWEEALGMWCSSASWSGLHGHLYLGSLAALNTLGSIRQSHPNLSSRLGEIHHASNTNSALASEYYSIAKRIPDRSWRKRLFQRALAHTGSALDGAHGDISGILAVRGYVNMALGNFGDAKKEFEAMRNLRERSNAGPAGVGEAQRALAMVSIRQLRLRKAKLYLNDALENLREGESPNFLIQALRLSVYVHFVTGNWLRARSDLLEAYRLGIRFGAEGQLGQMGLAVRLLNVSEEELAQIRDEEGVEA